MNNLSRRSLLAATAFVAALGVGSIDARAAELKERVLGDPDAPVTIVEYASMSCPHCASFHAETLPELKARFIDEGKAKLVFRDFPFDRGALAAAQLAHCADDRFFAFIDVFFENQADWARASDPVEALKQIAALGGLSAADADACLADEALADAILQSRLEAQRDLGVESTPTFFVGDEMVRGAQSIDVFADLIEAGQP